MEALLIVAAALGLYFLPTIVGWNKRNAGAIFALNFFFRMDTDRMGGGYCLGHDVRPH